MKDRDVVVVGVVLRFMAAAYLALAPWSSAPALQRRERLGGASDGSSAPGSSTRTTSPSPRANVVGLLDDLVIASCALKRGADFEVADQNMWLLFIMVSVFGQSIDSHHDEQHARSGAAPLAWKHPMRMVLMKQIFA